MGRVLITIYALLVIAFAIYGNWWGDFAYRGFAHNLGRALIWPTIIFPGLGKIVGAILIIGIVGLFALKRK